ncbi:MAG: PQQ-like beta-propeller repeat protein [Pirellulaceae bacterium]|nr:PQQ-like beta-propeller repeat protein [Pirellulaceae bacterium]
MMSSNASAASQSDMQSDMQLKPLRVWIPLLILPLMVGARFVPEFWTDGPAWTWAIGAFFPFLFSLALLIWWLTLSRARAGERLLGLLAIIAILVVEQLLAHETMRGPVFIVMTIPMTIGAFALGLCLVGRWNTTSRTVVALLLGAAAASVSLFARNDGVWGDFSFDLLPRWTRSTDQLVNNVVRPEGTHAIPSDVKLESTWPSFRGPLQDGVVRGGPVLDSDWAAHPPKELWRITVGPAWSSFVSVDRYLITQEQRGDEEAVVCYDADSGRQVWEKKWASRFFEALGGLGPRSTPTYADGFVYALGAAGTLGKLDVHDGSQIWDADIKQLSERDQPPMWGFSASPLIAGNLVVVHAGGKGDKGILAFDTESSKLAWSAPAGEQSYGSLQSVQLFGQTRLALLSERGAQFWDLNGQSVFDYAWPHQGYRALQPQIIDGDKLVIATGMGSGTRLVQLSTEADKIVGKEVWTSRELKPDFNDVVVHKGFLYGFDNRIFTCIDMNTGKRKWKGGHYEKGQALLVADSDLIIVVGEKGKLFLLRATPDKHEELGVITALSDKTWNHPVLIGDRLFLRNAAEAVAYQLPVLH